MSNTNKTLHEILKGVECLLIPRPWLFNICDPDPSVPYDKDSQVGILIGTTMASIFELWGTSDAAEKIAETVNEIITTNKQVLLDKTKVMHSIGVTSIEEIDQAIDRAVRWSLLTLRQKGTDTYCSLTKETLSIEHWNKIKTLSRKKLDAYEFETTEE